MEFGVCGGHKSAPAYAAAGFDFIEENVQSLLQGQLPDPAWTGLADTADCELPIAAANCLIPGTMKVVGPAVDLAALESYLRTILPRARQIGITTLVFGSGAARQVPDGFSRQTAFGQIVDFLKMAGPLALAHGITLVVEPLQRGDTNIINTVPEALEYVQAANSPAVRLLVDSYHFWTEKETLQSVQDAAAYLGHVHVADLANRAAPGESGPAAAAMYREFFSVLKRGGYKGYISVEAGTDFSPAASRVAAFLREQWEQA